MLMKAIKKRGNAAKQVYISGGVGGRHSLIKQVYISGGVGGRHSLIKQVYISGVSVGGIH